GPEGRGLRRPAGGPGAVERLAHRPRVRTAVRRRHQHVHPARGIADGRARGVEGGRPRGAVRRHRERVRQRDRHGQDAHPHDRRAATDARRRHCEVLDAMRGVPAVAAALVLVAGSAQAPSHQSYTETIPGTSVTFDMVAIPGGTFAMGSPAGERGRAGDEGPSHEVRIAPFWMEKTETTWNEYDAFAFAQAIARAGGRAGAPPSGADAITKPTPPYAAESFGFGKGRQPVISVQYHAAMEYCRWLSAATGKIYRLATEAEWEYAARAGTTTAYSFGDEASKLDTYAWYEENSGGHPHPVGGKAPNAWGLYDMHGNVAEWVVDHYDPGFYAKVPPGTRAPVLLPDEQRYPYVV